VSRVALTAEQTEARELFQDYLDGIHAYMQRHRSAWDVRPTDILPKARLSVSGRVAVDLLLLTLQDVCGRSRDYHVRHLQEKLLSHIARRTLPYTPHDARAIIAELASHQHPLMLPAQGLLRGLLVSMGREALVDAARSDLESFLEKLRSLGDWADLRKLQAFVGDILQATPSGVTLGADAWSERVLPLHEAMLGDERAAWDALLGHCAAASGAAPSAAWLREAQARIDAVGQARFVRTASSWLAHAVPGSRAVPEVTRGSGSAGRHPDLYHDRNSDLLRGLAWAAALTPDAQLAAVLGDLAVAGYRKISGHGPRSAKVAGACVHALKRFPGLLGAGQLIRVAQSVKQPTYRAGIDRALAEVAARLNLTRDDLEEIGVPTFDLTEVGMRVVAFGSSSAELRADGRDVTVTWRTEQGKAVKSPPVGVKRDFTQELADLKITVKNIASMLSAQRDRLDALLIQHRTWTLETWRERYLDHPVMGVLARRLIWTVNGTAVLWHAGALQNVSGTAVTPSAAAEVQLWHPVFADPSEVHAWRARLDALEVTQPFKQAHREVYLLTDAERRTRTYSNRFAAHVLRQHQFNALCAARGWRNTLRLMVDDTYPPATRELPQYGLRAEYWIEGIGENYGVDTNETGTYLRVVTDQVRFYPLEAPENSAHAGGGGYEQWVHQNQTPTEPVPLEQIPPLVLSEVLRDVDLFVGVASVGNDPTWQDGGPDGRYREYWASYSFGELSATAHTRRDVLTRLLPRLKIAERCALTDKFLVVRGDVRTYKIHLGSGNILMEPNDQYLCIVPARGAAAAGTPERVFVPFEGDAVFSVILSKAFMLANDTAITDPTITSQIKHRR